MPLDSLLSWMSSARLQTAMASLLLRIHASLLGLRYKGTKAGNSAFADAAVFAFYPNKQITTGEGGMVVTDDERIAFLCKSARNQGRGEAGVWLSHERLGYNYRMDELSAALGAVQMWRIEEIIPQAQAGGGHGITSVSLRFPGSSSLT